MNPWIVKHRYQGRFALHTFDGQPLGAPPTNYLIVGERVAPGQGVAFRAGAPTSPLGFLELEHYRDLRSGRVMDLVRRPRTTLDVVPWFEEQGALYVLSRTSYPRPILCAEPTIAQPLDGSRACPWSVEPLTCIQGDRPIGQTVEDMLREHVRLDDDQIIAFESGSDYYPSPGGVAERVESTFVRVAPTYLQKTIGARSGFSTSGRVQAIEAEQLLRAAQVGGISDARLELNVYELLARRGRSFGPWLGEELVLKDGPAPTQAVSFGALASRPSRRSFAKTDTNPLPFLKVVARPFDELDAQERVVATQTLEYVVPVRHAAVTVSIVLLRRAAGVIYVGLDDDDLPAAQCFRGNSELLVTPAWRIHGAVATMDDARAFLHEHAAKEHGVTLGDLVPLGGRYHPTPGATPEVVHPFFASVANEAPAAERALLWTPLADLVKHLHEVRDGHLRIGALRAVHALFPTR